MSHKNIQENNLLSLDIKKIKISQRAYEKNIKNKILLIILTFITLIDIL
jgi:hypothetical protein